MPRYRRIAREVAISTLAVYLLCKILGFILLIFFSAPLIKDGADKKNGIPAVKPIGSTVVIDT